MKNLKFREKLSKLILDGEKTTTWRLFDEKNISLGDTISLIVWETGKEFAIAKVTFVKETKMGNLTDEDWEGHERFSSDNEMYNTYSHYQQREVNENTIVKIIRFELI